MKVLKLKLFQQIANYRKPLSYNFIDTFPLPTYSNVRGWIHNILGAKEYIPMSISIQGIHESIFYDLQTFYKFDDPDKERGTIIPEIRKSVKKSPFYVATLYNVSLIIHISMKSEYLEIIKKNIYNTIPILGRFEDLVRIDEIKMVSVIEKDVDFVYEIKYPIYLKKETVQKNYLVGINYRLPFKYDINQGLRYFELVDAVYVECGTFIDKVFEDEEGDIVELVGDYYE
uniref:Type I-B CRISPR-associated protein Cas5 n=1 Tax=Dictyoglomus thermophilum TaxID=14 RepID=A0A7C3RWM5_DICTH